MASYSVEMCKAIGSVLKNRRLELGRTRPEMSKYVNRCVSTMKDVENGIYLSLTDVLLRDMCKGYDLDFSTVIAAAYSIVEDNKKKVDSVRIVEDDVTLRCMIGVKLASIRRACDKSQEELVKVLGFDSVDSIELIETGGYIDLSYELIDQYVEACSCKSFDIVKQADLNSKVWMLGSIIGDFLDQPFESSVDKLNCLADEFVNAIKLTYAYVKHEKISDDDLIDVLKRVGSCLRTDIDNGIYVPEAIPGYGTEEIYDEDGFCEDIGEDVTDGYEIFEDEDIIESEELK